jgi:hypothetical protein
MQFTISYRPGDIVIFSSPYLFHGISHWEPGPMLSHHKCTPDRVAWVHNGTDFPLNFSMVNTDPAVGGLQAVANKFANHVFLCVHICFLRIDLRDISTNENREVLIWVELSFLWPEVSYTTLD